MKTTKKQFEQFKESFLHYRDLLGLKEYEIAFFHFMPPGENDSYAMIFPDTTGMLARVYMAKTLSKDSWPNFSPKRCGKHECIHLLLANITDLGNTRIIGRTELSEENERIVRRLEKIL